MDLDALRNADFGSLDDAVADWSTMVGDLETLMDAAEKGLRGAANEARWAGVNATVSKEFIGKTAGEFTDAHSQASSIHRILQDTRDELRLCKGQLTGAIERGRQKNLTVIGYEGGFTVTTNAPPEGRAAQDQDNKGDIIALRDEIQAILDKATESDTTAGTVLMALADQSKLGFSDVDYSDRDSAAEALKDAEELADLAKQKPEDLSPSEFDRLDKGLRDHAGDELFAQRFAGRLGAQGTLDFWTGLNDPHSAWKVGQARGDRFDDLQKSLSLTLATASQSDNADMTTWKSSMVDLVDKPVGRSGGLPLGGQVMSNLMRWGDYDDRFLLDYGDKLIETEKKFTGNGRHGAWQRTGADPLLNRTGTDSGWDPMTGYLKALSNSPDAATDFFNGTFVTQDEDHDFTHDTDGDGKQGRRGLSNFDYLFEERDWPQDRDDKGEESIAGRNNLAAALEAATTGHPAGELPTVDTPAHDAEQAKLVESLVASIGEDPERLTEFGYMSDSIGQITSEYLPDISRAMSDVPRDSAPDGKWQNVERRYPLAGSAAELQHADVTKLLFAVGQNEEGYAAVEVGQKAYMAQLMDYHLDPNLPEAQRSSGDNKLVIELIALQSGEVSGTLNLGVREAIGSEATEKDKGYEHAVAQRKNLISGGVGTIVGVGTSFVATPWIGAVAGGTAGTVTSVVLESVFRDAEGQAVAESQKNGGQFWLEGKVRNGLIAEDGARAAAEKYESMDAGDAGMIANKAAAQGYVNAREIIDGAAPGTVTGF
ncbi:hypothetical protein NFX46_08480 [Streptomyces phaeoluteigriseus]|uniref:DUF6571 domain-containing protein n=1 Tax=Streptomyces phaeoluteigriseus TaxID=114686 RepID=A0ABY4Z5P9_9ACTN|nr:DUF6571 family protein [Streptomyces phaeoluteigriseus]USQ83825.1 hypothetical protein NFX46_08480 [Streptomyces phaeoluteigriseus]